MIDKKFSYRVGLKQKPFGEGLYLGIDCDMLIG